MIKHAITFITMAMIILSAPIGVFADEHENASVNAEVQTNTTAEVEITDKEVEELSTREGAKMRVLQLIHRIDIQIENANHIIERLSKSNTSVDLEALGLIVGEFEVLKEELESTNYSQEADILAQEYVATKKNAIDLSARFRAVVHEGISKEERETIREEVRERKEERLREDVEEIRKAAQEYAYKQIERVEGHYGLNSQISSELRAGNITIVEAKQQLRAHIQGLSPEDRQEIAKRIREENKKQQIQRRQEIDRIRDEALTLARERVQTIKNRAQNIRAELDKTLEGLTQEEIAMIKKDFRENREKYLEQFEQLDAETKKQIQAAVESRIRADVQISGNTAGGVNVQTRTNAQAGAE